MSRAASNTHVCFDVDALAARTVPSKLSVYDHVKSLEETA